MPASSIAQILLRLFSLNWILTGLVHLGTIALTVTRDSVTLPSFISPLVYLGFGVVVWSLAPGLCRLAARGNDTPVTLAGVTQEQLYSTTFIGLGTYFILSSFANVFGWIHFFIVTKDEEHDYTHKEDEVYYYEFMEEGLTILAGFALIFAAKNFARKLSRE